MSGQHRRYAAPYVLIPHSASGVYCEYYAAKYPDEVSAIVMLDTTATAKVDEENPPRIAYSIGKLSCVTVYTRPGFRFLTSRNIAYMIKMSKGGEMMICQKCGGTIESGSAFCEHCGAPVTSEVFLDFEENRKKRGETKLPRRRVWIVVCATALLAGAVGGYLFWSNTGDRLAAKQFARGKKFLTEQAYERSVYAFTQSMDNGYTDAAIYVDLAKAYLGMENTESAVNILTKGLDNLPQADRTPLMDTLTAICEDMLAKKDYNAVIGALTRINIRDADTYLLLADAYLALSNTDGAVNILREGMESTHTDGILGKLNGICEDFLARGEYDAVIGALEGSAAPSDEAAYLLLAEAYTGLGDTGRAVDRLLACRDATDSAQVKTELDTLLAKRTGNTPGNIVNGGSIVQQGDWLYYISNTDFTLYKMRTDGNGRVQICDDQALYLNVIGDMIYYQNFSDNRTVYKIKTDGTGREKLNGDPSQFVTVADGWIYYYHMDDEKLYKIRTDGTDRTQLTDACSYYINVVDDWVYYTDLSAIYKIRTDGTDRTKIMYCNPGCGYLIVDGDWLYYLNDTQKGIICRARLNGMRPTEICGDQSEYFNVEDDWIYYSNYDDERSMYKVRTDGTERTKLGGADSMDICIVEGWLYYGDESDYYKMQPDGRSIQKAY